MTDARHELLRRVFDEVLQADPSERKSILDHECGDDSRLRAQVEALLAATECDGRFLQEPVTPNGARAAQWKAQVVPSNARSPPANGASP